MKNKIVKQLKSAVILRVIPHKEVTEKMMQKWIESVRFKTASQIITDQVRMILIEGLFS